MKVTRLHGNGLSHGQGVRKLSLLAQQIVGLGDRRLQQVPSWEIHWLETATTEPGPQLNAEGEGAVVMPQTGPILPGQSAEWLPSLQQPKACYPFVNWTDT